jgi:hypothetical protein
MITQFLSAAVFFNFLVHPDQTAFHKWVVYATVALNTFFGLFNTFFAFNLGRFLPERDDE